MLSAIIVDQEGGKEEHIAKLIEASSPYQLQSIAILSEDSSMLPANAYHISLASTDLATAISEACDQAKSRSIALINASVLTSKANIDAVVQLLASGKGEFIYAPIKSPTEIIEMPDLSVDTLIAAIRDEEKWPLICIVTPRAHLKATIEEGRAEDFVEISAQCALRSIAAGDATQSSPMDVELSLEEARANSFKLDNSQLARCLRVALTSCNIEDLFPNHPWKEHQAESAAASFHTLSALFIRLGDFDSATECLNMGDSFEDSPRSLALKGIISLVRDESLDAVAQIVASLQEYEKRKKADPAHYLSFQPKNIEQLNGYLRQGLSALNRRDNKTAAKHFAKAVFDFDVLFGQCGVDKASEFAN